VPVLLSTEWHFGATYRAIYRQAKAPFVDDPPRYVCRCHPYSALWSCGQANRARPRLTPGARRRAFR
jgi:hypothetical protein